MWSVGAFLELPERDKLEHHLRTEHKELDLPTLRARDDSLFNYMVTDNGRNVISKIGYYSCYFFGYSA